MGPGVKSGSVAGVWGIPRRLAQDQVKRKRWAPEIRLVADSSMTAIPVAEWLGNLFDKMSLSCSLLLLFLPPPGPLAGYYYHRSLYVRPRSPCTRPSITPVDQNLLPCFALPLPPIQLCERHAASAPIAHQSAVAHSPLSSSLTQRRHNGRGKRCCRMLLTPRISCSTTTCQIFNI